MIRALVVMVLGAGVTGACGREEEPAPALVVPPAGAAATSAGTVPHGDHNPHFGGLVLMNGDLHFEVVLTRDGGARVYFSDATRAELPAATASSVTIAITQQSKAPEVIALHIDDSGESWVGRGGPIDDPAAMARVAYT